MAVTFDLPDEVEQHLRAKQHNLEVEAKESLLVELYRQGELTQAALSAALGFDRIETEALLQKHRVTEDLGSLEDYLEDARNLEHLRTSEH